MVGRVSMSVVVMGRCSEYSLAYVSPFCATTGIAVLGTPPYICQC